ncbi:hypothetical protein [Tabrizicola sp. BL-A-41-H6]|uniref:hypothetical protein n=1 Tax=Tabrizicola sp. BL-A-41-H6 TaxID=3421107 RepID=UPI003D66B429
MNIEKTISDLPNAETRKLKDLLVNANRILSKDPKHLIATRLRDALTDELARRKAPNRIRVGPLWWEPRDRDVAESFAYTDAHSTIPVAAIFKSATHTATRKAVYSVRIGDHTLDGRFAEVAVARQAGSDAWEEQQ